MDEWKERVIHAVCSDVGFDVTMMNLLLRIVLSGRNGDLMGLHVVRHAPSKFRMLLLRKS